MSSGVSHAFVMQSSLKLYYGQPTACRNTASKMPHFSNPRRESGVDAYLVYILRGALKTCAEAQHQTTAEVRPRSYSPRMRSMRLPFMRSMFSSSAARLPLRAKPETPRPNKKIPSLASLSRKNSYLCSAYFQIPKNVYHRIRGYGAKVKIQVLLKVTKIWH